MKKLTIAAAIMLIFTGQAIAQVGEKKEIDPRLEALVDESGYEYEVLDSGIFQILISFRDGRSQFVLINSHTSQLGKMEIREIWSVGYKTDGLIPSSVATNLLVDNDDYTFGYWGLARIDDTEYGILTANIAADADVETLTNAIQSVAALADSKEEKFMSGDDL